MAWRRESEERKLLMEGFFIDLYSRRDRASIVLEVNFHFIMFLNPHSFFRVELLLIQ